MIYIITWVLTTLVPASCPSANAKDEFGRTIMNACAVYHVTTKKDTLTKRFETKEAYLNFLNEAKKQSDVSIIKIDSLKK